ncbi:MAG: LysM peptidoglycan-binding domain-containing M23 family metallopeptidase [Spirochaetes bacterium]|nr:LysM peptidoglycan-binding domain-containing M23 family metallopeptidase [Spirochaetota bacterium]
MSGNFLGYFFRLFYWLWFACGSMSLSFLYSDYPHIRALNLEDPLYRQQQEDVTRSYERMKQGLPLPPLILYQYFTTEEDTIFSLSARFNLPYESIATLNSIESSGLPLGRRRLLIPNQVGLFLPETPRNEMERIMLSWRKLEGASIEVEGRTFRFLAQERFHSVERAFFLQILFVFPLKQVTLSSSYGKRISPITGQPHFHAGIDLAAPRGTPIFAARDGKVIESGVDPILGSYLIIQHAGDYQTVYGHLDSKSIQLNQSVESGMMVGTVGMTGATTGPHLHFEVRQKGRPVDPERLLPKRIESKP